MKQVVLTDVKKLEIQETSEPVVSNGNVLMKVTKASICGSDIHYWEVGQPRGVVFGHEFAGIVEDPGNRKDLKVGDRVMGVPFSSCGECEMCKAGKPQLCKDVMTSAVGLSLTNPGAYAEKVLVREDHVLKLSDNVSDNEGAMVEPAAVVYHGIKLININKNDKVLVIGGGIIGNLAAMFAKKYGASLVVLSETNEARGKKAIEVGDADQWLNALDADFVKNALTISQGGFDVVIDCCGNGPAINQGLLSIKKDGIYLLIGVSLVPVAIRTGLIPSKEITIKGSFSSSLEEFEIILDMMDKKEIDVERFIDETIGLEEAQDAFERLVSPTCTSVKIVIDPTK